MPFIPHTEHDIEAMLQTIGVAAIADLYSEIPQALRSELKFVPPGMSEMQIGRLMRERAERDGAVLCFAGAGAYEHHIPAAVWELTTRGEFYTAYTPYQAEASQGTLQLLYEYQSMMASLNGMEVSNASLYDGATALAEAVLMAVRCHRKNKSKKILMPATVHPHYRQVCETITKNQGIELVSLPYDAATGTTRLDTVEDGEYAALVIANPNFFGILEDVDAMVDWAKSRHILTIAVANPLLLNVLKPPGQWGATGVDIACGDGQPLGIPLASGGPYFGFICCKQEWIRQLPGRLVGRTVDKAGSPGFTLTLQAREQHIRRSKATSNICTNQGLLVTAATLYMSLMGHQGMAQAAWQSLHNTKTLVQALTTIDGVQMLFTSPHVHETVLRLPTPVAPFIERMAEQRILPGFNLEPYYPELGHALLVCATETKTEENIAHFTAAARAYFTG